MKFDRSTLQILILLFLFGQFYAVRMVKGSARETPEGLSFGMKPLVTWLRITLLPLLFAFFIYRARVTPQPLAIWMLVLLTAIFIVMLYQLPGTIILTPTAIVQRFWLRPMKKIQYEEIMALEQLQGGRITKVLGNNRVTIIHTLAHSASDQFKEEVSRRRKTQTASTQ